MVRFVECMDFASGELVYINFENVEAFEKVEQSGRVATKVNFVGGRYMFVALTAKQLFELVNAAPA